MTPSDTTLIPAPASLLAEVSRLLEYGRTKDCETSAALHTSVKETLREYPGRPAVPVPAQLLGQLQRTLLVLCISAGSDFPPGENVVRFARTADRLRALQTAQSSWQLTPASTPTALTTTA